MSSSLSTPNARQQVTVRVDQLPIHCPMPGTTLWNSHPRVYIPLKESAVEKAICPYCGTEYVLSR